MANKTKSPHGSKATFVRSNPSIAAGELVKLAKQQGMTLTVGHIYNIRASDKAKRKGGSAPSSAAAPDGALASAAAKAGLPRLDAQLRTLILRIGLP